MEKKLTQNRLKEVLHYDPETGIFRWRRRKAGITHGGIAGTLCNGYVSIGIDGVHYPAHRLAWLYQKGYIPSDLEIDHRDRVRNNNHFDNLRLTSHLCNIRNCSKRSDNTSGITGISWDKQHKKWRAHITILGKHMALGRFLSKTDAIKMRWEAEKIYEFPNCCTTSSAYNYLLEIGEI